ncbi:cytochrome P450 [Epithele typhae]|uniref:cytochrome P450 n=1 Tax=Epithele typhae TaxID=378194 RepID=UPI00200885C5|nr:cytochrome P450 [Epithele typhae]KAH9927105.1 cytochrome P450 [Epithele typhae]
MHLFDFVLLGLAAWLVSRIFAKRPAGPLPPGPKGYPIIGSLLEMPLKYSWLTFAQWSERWGDLTTFTLLGQRFLLVNNADDALELLEKKSAIYSSRSSIPVGGDMIGWSQTMIMQNEPARMREYRKLVGTVMASHTRVQRFGDLIEADTKQFLTALPQRTDTLFHELQKLAGSIVVTITYGYKAKSDHDEIITAVDKAMADFALVTQPGAFVADVFPILTSIPSWFPGTAWMQKAAQSKKLLEDMVQLPYVWVKKQMAAGTHKSSFVTALLDEPHDDAREELIKLVAASMYAGGADTTVSSSMTFFLAMTLYPEVQKKAQAELDSVIGHGQLPTLADRERLPYLNAILLEVLRWIPVAPMGFPHLSTEDDFHKDYFIPKGTMVMVNSWNLLHDPVRYTDPNTFNPDRFLDTPSHPAERDPRDFAFGYGRRKCPGIFFAEASIFTAVALTLAVYDIAKAVDARGKTIEPAVEPSGTLISHPAPFPLRVSVRSPKAQALLDSWEHAGEVAF